MVSQYRLRLECWVGPNGENRMVGGPGIVRDFDYQYVPFEAETRKEAVKLHSLAMEHGIKCPKGVGKPFEHGHRGTLVGLEVYAGMIEDWHTVHER